MDNDSDVSMVVHTTPTNNIANTHQHHTNFKCGKYQGKSFSYVRKKHPQYFIWLVSQPAGTVWKHFDFIRYCLDVMRH